MVSIANQTVLITGASSGIGAACAQVFAAAGARLILTARRMDRLETLAADLKTRYDSQTYLLNFDVSNRSAIEPALQSLPASWQTIDVLINNAGLSRGLSKLHEGEIDDWEEMIDTNVKGLLYITRAVLPGMVERGKGHVVNIGSIAGHYTYPNGNVYCASKAAVRALTEGLKMDLLGTPIRVSSVDPGLVETEFSQVRFHGDVDRAATVYAGLTPLTGEDVAEVVLFCVTRPAHVNVGDVILWPTDQAGPTLVNRRPTT